jgi:hypothetical protein
MAATAEKSAPTPNGSPAAVPAAAVAATPRKPLAPEKQLAAEILFRLLDGATLRELALDYPDQSAALLALDKFQSLTSAVPTRKPGRKAHKAK